MDYIRNWVRTELWDQVPVAISVIDREFRIVEANREFRENYGDWEGRACYEAYKGLSSPCDRCAAANSFADGQVREKEEQGKDRDGEQTHYLVQMIPLVRDNGEIRHLVETSTDITALKVLEREKVEAERLAAVGQTVAGLAHGIKNVLMGLEGGVYVVRSGMQRNNGERILEGWQMVEENIARITSFAKEFLEFARGRTPKVQLVDPNRVAAKVIELFQDSARLAGIALSSDLEKGLAYALMDEEGIHACLANLISNAIDACQAGDKPSPRVTLATREKDGILCFEVADDGCGMDYEVKKKIFTNFFSTKGSDKGTGLGLLTTKKIVYEHGGKVSFESTEGEGSCFRLEFPRHRLPRAVGNEERGPEGRGAKGE